jgi:hypothetical protein
MRLDCRWRWAVCTGKNSPTSQGQSTPAAPPARSQHNFFFFLANLLLLFSGVDKFLQDTCQTGEYFSIFTPEVKKQRAKNRERVSERGI